jgi:hypothetical protein
LFLQLLLPSLPSVTASNKRFEITLLFSRDSTRAAFCHVLSLQVHRHHVDV